MTPERHAAFEAIVLGGMLREGGMASFADVLDAADAERIHQYIVAQATEDRAAALAGTAAAGL